MEEKLKSSSKVLYGVCACIIILMLACYFGNNNVKGTYSADSLTCSSGYKILTSGGKSFCCPNSYSQVIKKLSWSNYYCVNNSSVVRTDINGSETCAVLQSCVAGSSSCENLSKSTTTAKLFSCSGSECTYYVKTSCVVAQTPSSSGSDSSDTTEAGCYLGAHMYQWFTTKPSGSAWTKVNITQVNCKGCESGYTLNDDGDCVKSNPPTTEAGCYTAYYMYQWFDTKPSSAWTKVSVTKDRCTGCVPGYVLNDNEECVIASTPASSITIAFKNGNTVVKTESCTIPSGSQTCTTDIIAPGPQTSSDSNKVFNGWGEKGCTSGSYTANAALRPAKSKTYYACYRDASGDSKPSADFSANKCTYSSLYTVTRDTRYLNCKYTNITYNNSATEDTVGNVSACCSAKGYMWVSENFTSSGYGNEYCLVCEDSSGGTTPTNPDKPDNPSNPSSTPSSTPSNPSNITDNPKTGSVAIFLVWIIALGTLVYAGVYFKQARENN